MQRNLMTGLCALVFVAGCTAPTEDLTLDKEDAAEQVATGARSGKADEADFCEELDWYGDGVCDWFCPREDQDCTGAECTVGVHSTCAEGQNCQPGEPASCEWPNDFCLRVLCGPGYYCDSERSECVPAEDEFCTRALCAPGTICNEEEDRCVPIECPPVLCALYCPDGFADGPDGCPTCSCREPDPEECSPVLCEIYCPYGFETNEDGCEICSCAEPPPEPSCVRGGCSSQLCVPADGPPAFSTCEWRPEYECIQQQTCERQADGNCGFTDTVESRACFSEL